MNAFTTRFSQLALGFTVAAFVFKKTVAADSGVVLEKGEIQLRVTWPISIEESGMAVFSLEETKPLIESLGIAAKGQPATVVMKALNPVTLLTVGSRDSKNPQGWGAFFDNTPRRPYQTHLVILGKRRVQTTNHGTRTTVSLAVFPAPHQFFYPQDEAYNLKFVWHGRNYGQKVGEYGFGIRQSDTGDKRFVPWFNAPPGTEQRLAVFYLLARGDARRALDAVARYTHEDRYKKLPGHLTFTSHYQYKDTEFFRSDRFLGGAWKAMPADLSRPTLGWRVLDVGGKSRMDLPTRLC